MAAVNDDTTHRCTVATDPLGARVGDDVGAEGDGALDVAAHAKGVVHNERNAVVVGDLGNRWDIGNVVLRVGDGLDVHSTGVLIDGCFDIFWVIADDELDLDVEFLHVDAELVVSSAVEP